MSGGHRFGPLLRRHRADAGLTIDELSAVSRVSVRAISDMERGRSLVPRQRTVDALIVALGLADAAAAALRAAAHGGRGGARPVALAPPRAVRDFTGREAQLRWVSDLVAGPPGGVAVVSGPPGTGKTALVLHAADRHAAAFPDGVLFLDLRGLDAAPPAPADLMLRVLVALGVRQERVQGDAHARSAQYRAALSSRRVLLLLDNAADEAQVRPLLPGSGTAMTIVTSRRVLSGLEAVERVALPVLTRSEAVTLLRRIIGEQRAAAEPEVALSGLAEACGDLPLALRIAGNRLLNRPDWHTEYLLRRLADRDRRLGTLVAGDLRMSAQFTLSYRRLSAPAAAAFRRLSLVPGADAGPELAAQLTGLSEPEAEAALEELTEVGLLQPGAGGRYRLHDLTKLFAGECLVREETPRERQRAEDGMVTWLLDTATAAGRWFDPTFAGRAAGTAPPGPGAPASTEEADRWLERESTNWLGALRLAFAAGWHTEVTTVAHAMHWYSERWRHWGSWLEVFQMSAASAEALGDRRRQAIHLNYVAWAYTTFAQRHDLADAPALEAMRLAREVGDLREQGWSWVCIGAAARRHGDAARAQEAARQALPLFEAVAEWDGYSQALSLLAGSLAQAGRHREAIDEYRRLEALLAEPSRAPSPLVSDITAGHLLLNIGLSQLALGRWKPAADSLQAALPLVQRSGVKQSEARCRCGLGNALTRLDRIDEARTQLRRTVRMARQVGPADVVDQALARLAEIGPRAAAGPVPGAGRAAATRPARASHYLTT
ncbi:tetratricopeptide repeat protein [Phytohabitans sp. LJ34]|uniref:tetratricopeptide repeat protein n=1 Tax=Phytohabitans sp. LJ34 TaxID=3452217 RepID=UPI003F8B19C5